LGNKIIDVSKGQLLHDMQDSQVNDRRTVNIESIAKEAETHSEITMTDDDADGSTDDGCIDAEDDKSVFEMLVSSFVSPL
jgi:hypothetical protein